MAVFLFGVLPVLHKRGIGRLIIGDEFDTSRRVTTQGIRHYDGLYDQSIWFDSALSRYFMRKGWSVSQFSMLRPLSELLIEKILVKRYAHIQEHQTLLSRHPQVGRPGQAMRQVRKMPAYRGHAHRVGGKSFPLRLQRQSDFSLPGRPV